VKLLGEEPNFGGRYPGFKSAVFKTLSGTRYLTAPGAVVLARTESSLEPLEDFLRGFEGFEGYLEDPPIENSGEQLVKTAGQLCYLSFGEKRTKNSEARRYFDHIYESRHGSVVEHASASILFYGVSRSLTTELIRHRAGFGFSQVSQRYVDGSKLRFVERPEFQESHELHEEFEARIDRTAEDYERLAKALLKSMAPQLASLDPTSRRKAVNQAARALLPNETEAPILVTSNVRGWRTFLEMRGSIAAEIEIRRLAVRTLALLRLVYPHLFGDFEAKQLDDGSWALRTLYSKV